MAVDPIGPFRIIKPLGNKRQRVYAAEHQESGRRSAIKLIKLPPEVSREEALKRLHKEVRYLSKLEHPHLVRFLGGGVANDRIYLEMECIEGESLSAILARRGRLEWDVAVQYAAELAEALDYLHSRDLLHSKLTPEKLLISGGHVKLTDLRLNRSRKRRWDARPKAELDVAAYLAPEQLTGGGATALSDLYSLGVILYEMVTGQLPYPPESLREMARRKQVEPVSSVSQLAVESPKWLDQVVETLLKPDPARRYPSARAVLLALREIQKMDAQKISAVAQLAGGFNPLTAGVDKREARQLLGRPDPNVRKPKTKPPFRVPAWLQITGLLCGLLLCSTVIIYTLRAMIPTFDGKIQAAHRILAEPDPSILDLRNATEDLEKLLQRYPQDPMAVEALGLVDELQTRRLLRLAEGGRVGNREGAIRDFVLAYQANQKENLFDALATYHKIMLEYEINNKEIDYIYNETRRQFATAREAFREQAEWKRAELGQQEDRTAALEYAVQVKTVFGKDPQQTEWMSEWEGQFPELNVVEAWDRGFDQITIDSSQGDEVEVGMTEKAKAENDESVGSETAATSGDNLNGDGIE